MPTPATKPVVLAIDVAALVEEPRFDPSSAEAAIDNKSGLLDDGNLVNAIGTLFVESPE